MDRLLEEEADSGSYSPMFRVRFWTDEHDRLHRDHDLPAVVRDNGIREFWQHGTMHCEGGPARTAPMPRRVLRVAPDANGHAWPDACGDPQRLPQSVAAAPAAAQEVESWWINGRLSRPEAEGPARRWADGTQEYWLDGRRHRLAGPAIEYPQPYGGWAGGPDEYWIHGQRHRTDGPARLPFMPARGRPDSPGEHYLADTRLDVERWRVLRHHTPESDRPTLQPDNDRVWDALVRAGAVNLRRESIDPMKIAAFLRLHPN